MNFIQMSGFLCIYLSCYAKNTLGSIKQLINHSFIIKITTDKDIKLKASYMKCGFFADNTAEIHISV